MITVISILGVAAGVMALVIALAVNNGFHNTLQRNLLGAMAHINVHAEGCRRTASRTGARWWSGSARCRTSRRSSPALYSGVFLTGPLQSTGALLKGVDVECRDADQRDAAASEGRVARPAARPGCRPARALFWARGWRRTPAWCSIQHRRS